MTDTSSVDVYPFLCGGGEMGARMRAFDWSKTELGGPEHWPQSLRSAVSICLNSPILATLLWGPNLLMLYNDAYIPSMADRHPHALGRPVADVWGTAWDQVAPPFYNCMTTGEGFANRGVELPMIRRGVPEISYWDFSAAPIRGEDGKIAGLFNQGIEITERVLAERKRDEHEADLKELNMTLERRVAERTRDRNDLWELSSDIMLRCDFDGLVIAVNPAWTEVLGWSKLEFVGRNISEFIHPDDIDAAAEGLKLSAQGHSYSRFDNRYAHKNGGYRWISWSTRPSNGVINSVGRDFTQERENLEALNVAEESLRQAQKMEAVGQLTGGLAHDFNNLLAGISGCLEMMTIRLGQERKGDVSRYIDMAGGAVKRASALTSRLLAFSSRQILQPIPVSVSRLVLGMEELIRRAITPNIDLLISEDPNQWPVMVDPSQLENALLNLCLNSRDSMPNGGQLAIRIQNECIDEKAQLSGLPFGDYVLLQVLDTGVGMGPDVLRQAFEPFFTTKPTGSGTGLGLSMTYGFVRQSGGRVTIISKVDKGTAVNIYLPRYLGNDLVARDSVVSQCALVSGNGETIVVVDDEQSNRTLICEVLNDLGYLTFEAADSTTALKLLRSDMSIDLLITDFGLPRKVNGRQMAEAILELRPNLSVFFITGYSEHAVIGDKPLQPGMQVITKPFEIKNITDKIAEVFRT
ncbi:hybrid sensor histidine kinase/response regulator [Pseudomonas amygdali pv. morsprunorum]|nr:hybrid sensor histidine kinase/response regulator [Pseudomonas amygdali pv. morsprunorum]